MKKVNKTIIPKKRVFKSNTFNKPFDELERSIIRPYVIDKVRNQNKNNPLFNYAKLIFFLNGYVTGKANDHRNMYLFFSKYLKDVLENDLPIVNKRISGKYDNNFTDLESNVLSVYYSPKNNKKVFCLAWLKKYMKGRVMRKKFPDRMTKKMIETLLHCKKVMIELYPKLDNLLIKHKEMKLMEVERSNPNTKKYPKPFNRLERIIIKPLINKSIFRYGKLISFLNGYSNVTDEEKKDMYLYFSKHIKTVLEYNLPKIKSKFNNDYYTEFTDLEKDILLIYYNENNDGILSLQWIRKVLREKVIRKKFDRTLKTKKTLIYCKEIMTSLYPELENILNKHSLTE